MRNGRTRSARKSERKSPPGNGTVTSCEDEKVLSGVPRRRLSSRRSRTQSDDGVSDTRASSMDELTSKYKDEEPNESSTSVHGDVAENPSGSSKRRSKSHFTRSKNPINSEIGSHETNPKDVSFPATNLPRVIVCCRLVAMLLAGIRLDLDFI